MQPMREESAAPVETPAVPEQPTSGRPRWKRVTLGLLALLVSVFAGALVTFFTIDLGPHLRERAEREGTKYMQRPLHIGRLSAKLTPGVFVIEDILIEGLEPGHPPFLKAGKIEVVLPW
jgi:hypothetical protein